MPSWKVTAPTKVVFGAEQRAVLPRGAKALVELLPQGRYRTLDGQDHSAFWTAPDAVAGTVTELLKR
jgi:pimeloyl-ACP methyl ester carboxylesterase